MSKSIFAAIAASVLVTSSAYASWDPAKDSRDYEIERLLKGVQSSPAAYATAINPRFDPALDSRDRELAFKVSVGGSAVATSGAEPIQLISKRFDPAGSEPDHRGE